MKKIKSIMTRDVETLSPETTVQDAARKMRSEDVGSIPVCDGRKVRGMITDRDIVIRGLAMGRDPEQLKVQDLMTDEVHYVFEDEGVRSAARKMQDKQIRRLVVVDRDMNLVGIVSLGDVSTEQGDKKLAAETLREVSQNSGAVASLGRSLSGWVGLVVAGAGTYALLKGLKKLELIDFDVSKIDLSSLGLGRNGATDQSQRRDSGQGEGQQRRRNRNRGSRRGNVASAKAV